MTIYQTLRQEHRQVRGLIRKIVDEQESLAGFRDRIFQQIQHDLGVHMDGEEAFFYPVLENNNETRDMVLEAYEEHSVARYLLKALADAPKDNDRWMARLQVFDEVLAHHIQEEEQELFPQAQQIIDSGQEAEILRRYEELRQSAMTTA